MDFLATPEDIERERAAATPTSRIGTHPGAVLRVSFNGEPLLQVNSDHLHYLAQYGGYGRSPDGWSEILRTVGGLAIEAQPVRLPNDYPDPIED